MHPFDQNLFLVDELYVYKQQRHKKTRLEIKVKLSK